jgi:hypothetical protein
MEKSGIHYMMRLVVGDGVPVKLTCGYFMVLANHLLSADGVIGVSPGVLFQSNEFLNN